LITDSQLNGYSERVLSFMQNSSDVGTIHLQLLAHTVKTDHIIEMFLSKLSLYDKVRVIYYTYFLSKGFKQDDIFILLDKIYIYTVEDYEEKSYVDLECDACYGDGYVECDSCDGSTRETCSTCDGEETVDCDSCNGEGTQECGYCDGKGSETEEDDEGDETEVECVHCDGEGTEKCDSCGGSGNFECYSCGGKGFEDCRQCDGNGSESCDYCEGSGQVQSDEEYYTSHYTTYRTTLDNLIFSFEEPMEDDNRIDELEYEMTLSSRMGHSDILVSDIDSEYDTDDWDRVVVVIGAEELTESSGRKYDIF
jgi:hypothetical protein